EETITVFRVNRRFPPPAQALILGKIAIFEPSLICELDGAIGLRAPCRGRDRIDDVPKSPGRSLQQPDPELVRCAQYRQDSGREQCAKPIRLVVGGGDREFERGACLVPDTGST